MWIPNNNNDMKILVNLCLNDLPKDLIKEVTMKDGSKKKFINIVVAERRETDAHGNTHTAYAYVPKDKRVEGQKTLYVGTGKAMEEKAKQPVSEGQTPTYGVGSPDYDEDLGF